MIIHEGNSRSTSSMGTPSPRSSIIDALTNRGCEFNLSRDVMARSALGNALEQVPHNLLVPHGDSMRPLQTAFKPWQIINRNAVASPAAFVSFRRGKSSRRRWADG